MTIGISTSTSNTSAATSVTTGEVTTTSGSLVVAFAAATNDFAGTPLSDNKTNTWNPLDSATLNGSGRFSRAFYSVLTSAGSGHTFTATMGTSEFLNLFVVEILNPHGTPDVFGDGVIDTGGSPWDSPNASPANTATVLAFTAVSAVSGTDTNTYGGSFASGDKILSITDADNRVTGSAAAMSNKAAATYSANVSGTVGTNAHLWIVTVREAAGGGGASGRDLMLMGVGT